MLQQPIQDRLPLRIILLGFMGSGKSTMGPMIANAIGYRFIDLDMEIEQRHDTTIGSVFNELGESGFRAIESAELRRVFRRERTVLSTGGGIVTLAENRRLIKDLGFSVYLKLSPVELAERLEGSKDRPMLFGEDGGTLSGNALVERVEQLTSLRSVHYESADLVVDLGRDPGVDPVSAAADHVVRAIHASAKRSI